MDMAHGNPPIMYDSDISSPEWQRGNTDVKYMNDARVTLLTPSAS